MEQFVLYLVIKELIKGFNSNFKYTFNDMDSNKDNVVGIYIKGAEPSEYRQLNDGKYYNIINRVQFLLQGGLTSNSLMDCLSLGSYIKDTLITTCNRYIIAPNKVGYNENGHIKIREEGETLGEIVVILSNVTMMSDLISLGKSSQGRPRYSLNFRIKYGLGGM